MYLSVIGNPYASHSHAPLKAAAQRPASEDLSSELLLPWRWLCTSVPNGPCHVTFASAEPPWPQAVFGRALQKELPIQTGLIISCRDAIGHSS